YSLSRGHAITRTASTDAARFFPIRSVSREAREAVVRTIRSHTRGGPDTLVYEDGPEPRIAAGEALVQVHAAAITPTELTWNSTWTDSNGKDRRPIVPSFEVSGTVERVGAGVTDMKRGAPVYGLFNF